MERAPSISPHDEDKVDRVWELMESISVCMLVTMEGDTHRARPMTAYFSRPENAIFFLTDARAHLDDEVRQERNVTLAFADPGSHKYVTVEGRGHVFQDREKVDELWNIFAKAYWQSPDDPNIRVLRVEPHSAEYWDSPGKIVSAIAMITGAVTGTTPKFADKKKVAL